MPSTGIAGLYGSFIPSVLRSLPMVLHSGCINLHSHQLCKRIPFSPHTLQHLLFIEFLIMAIQNGVRCYLTEIFICISLNNERSWASFLCLLGELLISVRNGRKVKVAQSCLTLCDPMDNTVLGILQARILKWVAFPFSRGSSQPRDWTPVSHMQADSLPAEPQGKPKWKGKGLHYWLCALLQASYKPSVISLFLFSFILKQQLRLKVAKLVRITQLVNLEAGIWNQVFQPSRAFSFYSLLSLPS